MKHDMETTEWVATTDGEANFYGIATEEDWLMRIQQNGELSIEQQESNIRVIVAAKHLLEVCKWLEDAMGRNSRIWCEIREMVGCKEWFDEFRAAIAKTKKG